MSAAPRRLLGLGDNTLDTYVDLGLQFPGGNAVNVAVFARRLGAVSGYLGCLGDDAGGDLLFAALGAEGVDLSLCRRRAGANARALIGLEAGERRFLGASPGVRARYGLEAADFAAIAGYDLVHTSINSEIEAALPRIRATGAPISYDFSYKFGLPRAAEALPAVDIAFLSCPGHTDAAAAGLLHEFAAAGPTIVVAMRGAAGAMALAGGEIREQAAMPIDPLDTLGAGDGFIAAFVLAHLAARPIAAALEEGTRFAASVCGAHGAFGHARAWSAADGNILEKRGLIDDLADRRGFGRNLHRRLPV